jgi:hypothetical protein
MIIKKNKKKNKKINMSFDYLFVNNAAINHAAINAINNFNLPLTTGNSGQVLTNNGNGTTSWISPAASNNSVGVAGELNAANGSGGWQDANFAVPMSAGTNGQVLTNNGSGGTTWQTSSSSPPSFLSYPINPLEFGVDFTSGSPPVGATTHVCFVPVGGFSNNYFQSGIPPPGGVGTPTGPSNSDNYGTIKRSLPAGNYNLSGLFGTGSDQGQLTVTINGVATVVDLYTVASGTFGMIVPFTVSGSGYQTVAINFSCVSRNGSSTNYYILPSVSNLVISSVE